MYVPAFFEIFLGLVAVVVWGQWLVGRPTTPAAARWVPWIVGGGVMIGQATAAFALVQASAGVAEGAAGLVSTARWASLGWVVLGLLALAGLTAASFLRKQAA